jgi:acyl-CoA dehydrogenase
MDSAVLEDVILSVRRFVREGVVPAEQQIEDDDEVPTSIRQAARDMGLFGFAIPEVYGGLGLGMHEEARLVMELGYTTPALRSLFGTNNGIAGHVLLLGGTEQQRTEWLPPIASGEAVSSFALTEPDAGSSPADLRTSAVPDGGDWVLNGTKRYITNAPSADLFLVFARTDPSAKGGRGISCFIVPRATSGLSVGPSDRKMGQFGAKTADVVLDDVRLPSSAVVGGQEGLGKGYATAMGCLAHGRVHIAALCVGMADRLVDESVSYAQSRTQGGKPIASFQLIQGLVADSQTDYLAGRSLVLAVAEDFDRGGSLKGGPSCAKYFASEMVGRVADRAVQIHGGLGYMRGVPVERFFRDARLFRIYEGTSQIQQVIIARELLGKAVNA